MKEIKFKIQKHKLIYWIFNKINLFFYIFFFNMEYFPKKLDNGLFVDYIPSYSRICCNCNDKNKIYQLPTSIVNHFNTNKHTKWIYNMNSNKIKDLMHVEKQFEYYKPLYDQNSDIYFDYIPNFEQILGLMCECINKQHIYRNQESFSNHIMTQTHVKWLKKYK